MSDQKILFITLSNIGDVVLTTPAIEALNQSYPNAKIDIVCDQRSAALFEFCPYRQHIFIKEKNAGLMVNLKLILALRKTHYDIAVDLRTDVLLKFVRAKRKLYKLPNRASRNMHSAVKHFAALKAVSKVDIPATKLWSVISIEQKIDYLMKAFQKKRILALGLGANFEGKVWPVARYVELSVLLRPFFDAVVLLGSDKERLLSEYFIAQSHLPTFNFCGKLCLIETFEVLKRVAYFVGNDSGLGHIASAAHIPTFTIFGPGSPVRYLPWSKKARFFQAPNLEVTQISAITIANLIAENLNERLKHSHLH